MTKKTIEEVSRRFAALGARNPDEWAGSEVREGGQLARFLFLRQAWRRVIPHDPRWIAEALANAAKSRASDGPEAAFTAALTRVLERASAEDLTMVVRFMQWELLAELCYLLDDPSLGSDAPDVAWRLFQTDPESGEPHEPIDALHESVFETEPTGRWIRSPKD